MGVEELYHKSARQRQLNRANLKAIARVAVSPRRTYGNTWHSVASYIQDDRDGEKSAGFPSIINIDPCVLPALSSVTGGGFSNSRKY